VIYEFFPGFLDIRGNNCLVIGATKLLRVKQRFCLNVARSDGGGTGDVR